MFYWLFNLNNPADERDAGIIELVWRTIVTAVRFPINRIINSGKPFFAPGAVAYLENYLEHVDKNQLKVFEYGAGTSSYWWANHVGDYHAVEHAKPWYDKVVEEIDKRNLQEYIDLTLIEPLNGVSQEFDWENNWKYYDQLGHKPSKPEFREYIATIDSFEDSYFDIISIDGRERVGSAFHAYSKVKPNGLVIFDDSSRPRYSEAMILFDGWESKVFDFGLQQTILFFGPDNPYFDLDV